MGIIYVHIIRWGLPLIGAKECIDAICSDIYPFTPATQYQDYPDKVLLRDKEFTDKAKELLELCGLLGTPKLQVSTEPKRRKVVI